MIEEKTCCRCGLSKPVDDFGLNRSKKDNRQPACRDCISARQAELYRADPKRRANQRKLNLKRLYGMTIEEWDARYRAQRGLCAACGYPPPPSKRLEVDHSHETGATRELLCPDCNKAFGHLHESPERIRSLAVYAEKWGARGF